LLAHLLGIYDEEMERHGDHEQAVSAAIKRFGPSEELARRIAAALPWHAPIMARIPLLAPVREWPPSVLQVGMAASLTGILCWLIVGLPWGFYRAMTAEHSAMEVILWWGLFAIAGVCMLFPAVAIIGASNGVFRQPLSYTRVALFAVLQYVLLSIVCVGLALLKGNGTFEWSLNLLLSPAIFPCLMVALCQLRDVRQAVRTDDERGQRSAEWERLDLS